ncbi:MAG TPA: PDZ domain-containing protein [Gemmatimonadales bacterium]|nr:PDZ domain-containing protein [Gemmatimonadales bacterium]
MYRWTGAVLALLTVLPATVLAQDSDRDHEDVRVKVRGEPLMRSYAFSLHQGARLGLSLNLNAADETKSQGALVMDVTEGSGADDAGLRAGDIITRYEGTSLGGDNPAEKLVELASDLSDGDSVKLEYRRDGKTSTVTVVASELENQFSFNSPSAMSTLRRAMPAITMDHGSFSFFSRGALMGVELAEMNSGLSEYFGTSEGLLVLSVDEDATIPLQAGDVILSLDGRTPRNEGHAMRILGSYAPGETVKFEVQRKRERQTIDWTVPERDEVKVREGRWISPSAPARRSVSPVMRVSPRSL